MSKEQIEKRIEELELIIEQNQMSLENMEIDYEDFEDEYCEMIDESTPEIKIGNLSWNPSYVLREVDPIAYRTGMMEYVDSNIDIQDTKEYKELEDEIQELQNELEELEDELEYEDEEDEEDENDNENLSGFNKYKVGKHKTKVFEEEDYTIIKYHQTEVVKFNNNKIILNSGGYKTLTTKVRMNQASAEYNLGFEVFQKKNKWYINYKGKEIEFKDNIILKR